MTTTETRLYRLVSVIDDWPHRGARYNNVRVTWFVNRRDYDPGFDYAALLDRPLPLVVRGAVPAKRLRFPIPFQSVRAVFPHTAYR